MKTLVAILNHNLPEYTDYLYEALAPYQSNIYDLAVIDNGSNPESKSKYTTLEIDTNVYFGGGFNAAMQYVLESTEYDSLLFMNNDLIVFGYNFVKQLKSALNNGYDIVSPCFFNVEPNQQCHWKTMHNWGAENIRTVPFIDFQCPLISRRLLNEVKEIDADLLYGWGIDTYFAYQCKKHNWKIGVMDNLCALHYNSLTVKKGVANLSMQDYCRNAELGQYNFFTKNNLMVEYHSIRHDAENYRYE